jgi:hypothetical protein
MKLTITIIITALILSISALQLYAGEPTVVPKTGKWCPSGYVPDGNYCRPGSNAKEVIVKTGKWCPRGFASDGNYCKRTSAKPSTVIPKSGKWCPRGYVPDGDYCCSLD